MSQRMLLGGRYRVEEELGRGGMAKVFKGTDEVLGRPVAVKVLAPQFVDDEQFIGRFRREAQAAASLNHPNLVSVYDTGSDDGIHYIVMEYVEGKTLAAYLGGGGRILPDRAMELAEDVCRALSVAHAAGVVHRDVKPGNIMVTNKGQVKVTDFGIARMQTSAETIAQTVAVLGTASYLSPEQAQGHTVDARSDIYSLGCVLYEMVAGRPPFAGDSPVAVASKHVLETVVPPSKVNPDVPPELNAVVLKALAKNPANRYQSAEELRADLERVRRGEPVLATPVLPESEPRAAAATTRVVPPSAQPTAVLPPPEEPGRGGRWAVAALVTLLSLAVLAGGLWFLARGLLGDGGQEPVPQVTVPSVTGLLQAGAESILRNEGLEPVVDWRTVEDPAQVGWVLEQDPPANELVDEGSEVTIVVGKAPRQIPVPDLTGKTVDEARDLLQELELELGTVVEAPSDTFDVGQIIDQTPPANTPVDKGTPVNVVVSTGPDLVTIPEVRCQSFASAQNELEKAGLDPVISDETVPLNPACPLGNKVAAQYPAPGEEVAPGDVVTLYAGVEEPSPTPPESPSP